MRIAYLAWVGGALVAGCGSPISVSGTVNGRAFTAQDGYFTSTATTSIMFTDYDGVCSGDLLTAPYIQVSAELATGDPANISANTDLSVKLPAYSRSRRPTTAPRATARMRRGTC